MLGKKGAALVVVLLVAAVLFTGEARSRLDRLTESFRNDFREMLYLPRGDSLKLIACGFDAPLADALYIKGLVFYAQSLDIPDAEREAARSYSYALFDVITDLSPRFHSAYQTGGTLLASANSLDINRASISLLEKGVRYWTGLEEQGETVAVDPRWLFHVMEGVTYNLNIQNRLMRDGKMEEAGEARQKAADQFRLAALSPQAPAFVMDAAVGFQRARSGGGNVAVNAAAVLLIWEELRERALAKGEKEVAEDLSRRMEEVRGFLQNVSDTWGIEAALSRAGKAFLAARGRAPRDAAEMAGPGVLGGVPPALPLDDASGKDEMLPMPDGSFKSRRLAELESARQIQVVTDSLALYRRTNRKLPPDLPTLVGAGFLDVLPVPPLAAAGQRFDYDATTGRVDMVMPQGPGL